ncbi:MAG TPA: hypothetical protein VJP80_08690 [Candidatus Saccharimonadales bacterium]|nr:hypothetical protein [Candidatus Saccharimonadales bacterium]
MVRFIAVVFVASYLLAAFCYAGKIAPRAAGGATGKITFKPQCRWLVNQIFANSHYVPTFVEFNKIKDEIDRCNDQYPEVPR